MKVVINKCFGGFSISKECAEYMEKLGSSQASSELDEWRQQKKWMDEYFKTGVWPKEAGDTSFLSIDAKYHKQPTFHGYGCVNGTDGYDRSDKYLVEAVEKLGEKANGSYAKLKIVEIPDGVDYEIDEYDGNEHIAEKHRTWG